MEHMITVKDAGAEFQFEVNLEGLQLNNDKAQKELEKSAQELMKKAEKQIMENPPEKWYSRGSETLGRGKVIDRDAVKEQLGKVAVSTEILLKEGRAKIQPGQELLGIGNIKLELDLRSAEIITNALNQKLKDLVATAEGRSGNTEYTLGNPMMPAIEKRRLKEIEDQK